MLLNRRVVALAYDGLCTFEFGVATELFGLPRPELAVLGVDWYEYAVVSADPGPLRALGGITIDASTDLDLLRRAGTVVVPGWRDPDEAPPGAVLAAIVDAHAGGARVMSICSGVFVLAAAGLLDGRPATTHWRYADRLGERYPSIDVRPDVLYVDDGSVLTSAGSAAGLDLGLHLIRRDHGAHIANLVARRLVLAPHRSGGQAQFVPPPSTSPNGESPLAAVMEWIVRHLAEPVTVEQMARRAAMSPRTFARRFGEELGMAPHQWLVEQRVARAQELLETTDASIDQVAAAAGFGSAANLRHHFQRATTTTPTAYRATFTRRAS